MRYGWSEMVIENTLQFEESPRDTILAILREADNHWNATCHTDICTSPTELELVGRHNDIEQTKTFQKRKLHTNQVADSAEAQKAQEIGYVMLSNRAQDGMVSLPPIHDKRSEQFDKTAHRRAVKLGKKCYQEAIMQWIDMLSKSNLTGNYYMSAHLGTFCHVKLEKMN